MATPKPKANPVAAAPKKSAPKPQVTPKSGTGGVGGPLPPVGVKLPTPIKAPLKGPSDIAREKAAMKSKKPIAMVAPMKKTVRGR